MELFPLRETDTGLHIEGVPDAVKVVRIDGANAQRLADMSLHQSDLKFALECLEAINTVPDEPNTLRRALWHSAIIHYIKCFRQGIRVLLNETVIYQGNALALEAFQFFLNLRNKHIAHDVNAYMQSLPTAALNNGTKPYKIEKIICATMTGVTLDQNSYNNLHSLVSDALKYVTAEFDVLCGILTSELEQESYESLSNRMALTVSIPPLSALKKRRDKI